MQPNPNLENVEPLSAEEVLSVVLSADPGSRPCVTCSFQAEDMIVLRMLKARLPEIPVLFLDTGYHFAQTYQYRSHDEGVGAQSDKRASKKYRGATGILAWNS